MNTVEITAGGDLPHDVVGIACAADGRGPGGGGEDLLALEHPGRKPAPARQPGVVSQRKRLLENKRRWVVKGFYPPRGTGLRQNRLLKEEENAEKNKEAGEEHEIGGEGKSPDTF